MGAELGENFFDSEINARLIQVAGVEMPFKFLQELGLRDIKWKERTVQSLRIIDNRSCQMIQIDRGSSLHFVGEMDGSPLVQISYTCLLPEGDASNILAPATTEAAESISGIQVSNRDISAVRPELSVVVKTPSGRRIAMRWDEPISPSQDSIDLLGFEPVLDPFQNAPTAIGMEVFEGEYLTKTFSLSGMKDIFDIQRVGGSIFGTPDSNILMLLRHRGAPLIPPTSLIYKNRDAITVNTRVEDGVMKFIYHSDNNSHIYKFTLPLLKNMLV